MQPSEKKLFLSCPFSEKHTQRHLFEIKALAFWFQNNLHVGDITFHADGVESIRRNGKPFSTRAPKNGEKRSEYKYCPPERSGVGILCVPVMILGQRGKDTVRLEMKSIVTWPLGGYHSTKADLMATQIYTISWPPNVYIERGVCTEAVKHISRKMCRKSPHSAGETLSKCKEIGVKLQVAPAVGVKWRQKTRACQWN